MEFLVMKKKYNMKTCNRYKSKKYVQGLYENDKTDERNQRSK